MRVDLFLTKHDERINPRRSTCRQVGLSREELLHAELGRNLDVADAVLQGCAGEAERTIAVQT